MGLVNRFIGGINSRDNAGKRRIQRVKLSGIITLMNRFVTMGGGLVSIPLLARYLGTERFGLWLTLSTFLTWVAVADLGLANSLTNALSTAHGKENKEEACIVTTNAVLLVLGLTTVITICLLLIHPAVAWEKVFNVHSPQTITETSPAVLACILIFCSRLFLSLPQRIFSAYQETYIYQGWSLLGNAASFLVLLVASKLEASLPVLLIAFFGTASLGDLFAGIHVFRRYKWLTLNVKYFELQNVRWLFGTGVSFWLAQISAIVMFQTDLIVVAQLFGAREVATYGVVLKLFAFVGTISYSFLGPLWPAYSEALARGDLSWINKTFKRATIVSLAWGLLSGILLVLSSRWIVGAWVGQEAIPSYGLLLAMFSTSVITVIAHSIGVLVGGLCEVSLAAFAGILQGFFNILLSIALGWIIGPSGVAWATGISLLMFSVGYMGSKILKRLKALSSNASL